MKLHPEVLVAGQKLVLSGSASIAQKWGAYLAGGAGIALQLGHRRSADFDWFTHQTVPPAELLRDVKSLGLPVEVRQNDEGTFLGAVAGLDYSVFRYRYPLVAPVVSFQGCQLASLKDIAAMKMTAIVQRAVKRDYVDLHALFELGKLPLREVVTTMERKYQGVDPSLSLHAMTHFKDVDKQPMPDMLMKISWGDVKRGLTRVRERDVERSGVER
jgi:hypothetical protein